MEDKILAIFKTHKDTHISGEDLSEKLGVSRTAVWKHVEKLRKDGYGIEAQPHLGYRLIEIPDHLSSDELKWQLNTKIIGRRIYSYNVVDSTNTIAYRLAEKGQQEGTVITAEAQEKGKGRLGRKWISPKSKGIYLSLILKPDITPNQISQITLTAAVAVCLAIRKTCGVAALIKWPNDVLVGNKKVCGVLSEMNAEPDKVNFIILGIGINVNTKKELLPDSATSLKEELGQEVSRINLAKELLREIERQYAIFKSKGFAKIVEQWKNLSATLGKRVKCICHNRKIEGQAVDIDSGGALMVRLDGGFIEKILSGDVFVVR